MTPKMSRECSKKSTMKLIPSTPHSAPRGKPKLNPEFCKTDEHPDYLVVNDSLNSGDIASFCPRCKTFFIYNIHSKQKRETKALPDHLAYDK